MGKCFLFCLALDVYILFCNTFIIIQFLRVESYKYKKVECCLDGIQRMSEDHNVGTQKGRHLNAISNLWEGIHWTYFSTLLLFWWPPGLSFSAFNIRFWEIQLTAVPYCLISQEKSTNVKKNILRDVSSIKVNRDKEIYCFYPHCWPDSIGVEIKKIRLFVCGYEIKQVSMRNRFSFQRVKNNVFKLSKISRSWYYVVLSDFLECFFLM